MEEQSAQPAYEEIPVRCEAEGETPTAGRAWRRDLAANERLSRGLRVFGICFGVGLLTVFIPILHFILPPGFLLLGIVLGWTTYMEQSEVQKIQCTCPNCKKEFEVPRGAEEWPKAYRCPGCSYTLNITRAG